MRTKLELKYEFKIEIFCNQSSQKISHTSKKSSQCHKQELPVLETDTGGEVENTKEREITLLKELGKITL